MTSVSLATQGPLLLAPVRRSSSRCLERDDRLLPVTVSLALGGEGLGTAWGKEKATEMLAAAGFKDVDVKEIDGDYFNYYYVAR